MKPIFVLFAVFGVIYGQDLYGCKIEGLDFEEYDDYIYYDNYKNNIIWDDHKGPLLELKKGSITGVENVDYSRNIAVSIKGDKIIFELVDSLEDFDYKVRTDNRNITYEDRIEFTCESGSSEMYFSQTIADRNTHVPQFNRAVYKYKFGMDIAAGFDLTDLIEIIAVDVDFTDYKLTFSIEENEYLKIDTKKSGSNMGKLHHARLETIKDINGKFERTFKISVMDTNEPRKTGVAEVRLIRV